MDRRTTKTKSAIYRAFNSLLAEKRYSKITIQEIIDRADVGRSTFYSHFETKDELLKSMCADMFDNIHFSSIALTDTDPESIITRILYHIKENNKSIKGVFSSNSGELFTDYFKQYFSEKIEKHMLTSYSEEKTGIPKDFLMNHLSGSFMEMIKWWSDNNMKQSPEELARCFITVSSPLIMLFDFRHPAV